MHFDNVEMTLKEVVDMSNNDLRTNGLSVIENTKMKLAGYDAYKTVFIGKLLGVEIKNNIKLIWLLYFTTNLNIFQ